MKTAEDWVENFRTCEFWGFVESVRENKTKSASLLKPRAVVQFFPEKLGLICTDDSTQVLLN